MEIEAESGDTPWGKWKWWPHTTHLLTPHSRSIEVEFSIFHIVADRMS